LLHIATPVATRTTVIPDKRRVAGALIRDPADSCGGSRSKTFLVSLAETTLFVWSSLSLTIMRWIPDQRSRCNSA